MKPKNTLSLRRTSPEAAGPERLQKLLSKAGLGSRRSIEERILRNEIEVDHRPAKIGDSLADGQTIKIDGRSFIVRGVAHTGPRVLAYNKPEGEVTTAHDPEGRPTVFDRLPRLKGARWIAVGRLDLNTAGLLLFTTDGELANRLMHPSREIDREYLCRVHGEIDVGATHQLTHGVVLEDGPAKFEELEALSETENEGSNRWYRVLLREGRQREVRRLWEAVGTEVSRLKRVRYGPIELGKDLKRGWYRELVAEEIEVLLKSVELPVTSRTELRIVPAEAAHKFDRGQRRERRPGDKPGWRREADESFAERGSRSRGPRRDSPAGDRGGAGRGDFRRGDRPGPHRYEGIRTETTSARRDGASGARPFAARSAAPRGERPFEKRQGAPGDRPYRSSAPADRPNRDTTPRDRPYESRGTTRSDSRPAQRDGVDRSKRPFERRERSDSPRGDAAARARPSASRDAAPRQPAPYAARDTAPRGDRPYPPRGDRPASAGRPRPEQPGAAPREFKRRDESGPGSRREGAPAGAKPGVRNPRAKPTTIRTDDRRARERTKKPGD